MGRFCNLERIEPMKVLVKPDLCCGAHLCAQVAGNFYQIKDGFNALVTEPGPIEVPEGMEDAAVSGAEVCPESAIIIIND